MSLDMNSRSGGKAQEPIRREPMPDGRRSIFADPRFLDACRCFNESIGEFIRRFNRAMKPVADACQTAYRNAGSPYGDTDDGMFRWFGELQADAHRPCHCLCAANHKNDHGICQGRAETTVRFDTQSGLVDVQMCPACATATRGLSGATDE